MLSGVLTMMGAQLSLEDDTQPVKTNCVSANFFKELGATAAYGRLDAGRDEAADAPPVVVLGHEFWQRRFGADPDIVGKGSVHAWAWLAAGATASQAEQELLGLTNAPD